MRIMWMSWTSNHGAASLASQLISTIRSPWVLNWYPSLYDHKCCQDIKPLQTSSSPLLHIWTYLCIYWISTEVMVQLIILSCNWNHPFLIMSPTTTQSPYAARSSISLGTPHLNLTYYLCWLSEINFKLWAIDLLSTTSDAVPGSAWEQASHAEGW